MRLDKRTIVSFEIFKKFYPRRHDNAAGLSRIAAKNLQHGPRKGRAIAVKAFGNYHPFVLMFYFLSVLLTAMFISNPILQATALLGGILFCLMLQKRSEITGNIGFYIPLFLIIAVTNPLFSHNGTTPLFFLNGNPVTLEAFLYGIAIAVTVVGVMMWCKCYSEIMTSDKFLYLFGKTVPKLSLILSMALRFVPMYKRQLHKVGRAQKAMGLYSSKSFSDKIRSGMRVFMAMISWSLENAMDTSASMKARGYGIKGRTHFSLFRFYPGDAVLLAVCVCLLSVTIAGTAAGETVFYYYPRLSAVNLSLYAVTVYAAFGILSFLPFIIEVKEAFLWKYYISKI